MSASGIAHLHVASGYSARYGASLPHALVRRAAERGVTALALTDRNTVADTVRFAKAAAAAGIRPVSRDKVWNAIMKSDLGPAAGRAVPEPSRRR